MVLFSVGLESDNPIDNLVKEALEYIRKLMQEHEPFSVGDIPTQHIQDSSPPLESVLHIFWII